jgi:hypothetical protein
MITATATVEGATILRLPQLTSVLSGKSTEGAMKTHATAITTTSAASLVIVFNEMRKP